MMKKRIEPQPSLTEQAAATSAGEPPSESLVSPAIDTDAAVPEGSPPSAEEPQAAASEAPLAGQPESENTPSTETPPLSADQLLSETSPPPANAQAAASEPAADAQPTAEAPPLPADAPMSETFQPAPASSSSSGKAPITAGSPSPAWRSPWLLVVLVALGLAGWQWLETRQKLADTQQELARRLADSDTSGAEIRALSKGAQEQVAGMLGRLGALEEKIGESQSQQATLEKLYKDLARNRDEWALAEVEQSVTLAAQQLQLAGNVQGAVLALQTADARLAASSRPQFSSLRKVLSGDLERLRALPQIDLAAMSQRLESVITAIDTLPLAVAAQPQPSQDRAKVSADAAAQESSTEWPSVTSVEFWQRLTSAELWRRLGREFWGEVKSLIRIQRMDGNEPAFVAPGQAFFLRENIKLRLLNARLALLGHDQVTFHDELKHAKTWMDRYFDAGNAALQTAQSNLEQLIATQIDIEMPTLNDSLSAIKTFKLGQER